MVFAATVYNDGNVTKIPEDRENVAARIKRLYIAHHILEKVNLHRHPANR
jgi:hypothetical protein